MRPRGEIPHSRSVLTRPPVLVAVTSVTGALLVALPSSTPTAGGAVGDAMRGPASRASVAAGPSAVRPEVRETRIPAVRSAGAPAAVPGVLRDEHSTDRLAGHVRVGDLDEFSMLGVTWAADSGSEHVSALVRTRTGEGWTGWTELHVDPEEGPAAGEEPGARAGTEPLYVGDSTGVEVSVYTESGAAPRGLRVSTIDGGQSSYDAVATAADTGAAADTSLTTPAAAPGSGPFPALPPIITRRQWGADPSLGDQCWPPRYGTTFKNVFVHHTVSSNDYSEAESASIVRGIYAYHTQSRGWCDIGYNFLVDRYGNIYEGRRGGIRKPVRGAHAGDYNTNSTGISLIGEFETAYPTRRMKHALVQLIAWRMGTAYHGAYGKAKIYDRRFKRISGHRDAMSTACPGQHVYDWLPRLRGRVSDRLGDYESAIERRWRAIGAGSSWLGVVKVGERGGYGGRWTTFRHGRMFASDAGVAALPFGPILRAFGRVGGLDGKLGYPTSGIRATPDRRGTVAVFERGRIWHSSATGARAIHSGAILNRYLNKGGAAGPLGFPTRATYPTGTGTRADFEHGYITWTRSTGRTEVTYR